MAFKKLDYILMAFKELTRGTEGTSQTYRACVCVCDSIPSRSSPCTLLARQGERAVGGDGDVSKSGGERAGEMVMPKRAYNFEGGPMGRKFFRRFWLSEPF